MSTNFPSNPDENQNPENQGRKPKKVKHILVGSPEQVRKTIIAIYSLKYAYPEEWSTPEPTGNPGEVMVTLIRNFYLD
ncbi:MAG: hypothetical protein F6J94_22530 [Moorea sp. SIO1F2]|uniref:hypothetical protein n=1 Tax=unclassified Moorena TaxID=2683338 RepID=UPI0013B5CE92|nr:MULTISPECIES: hypothetical protein [unclassified Moorena]NEN99044.1 hypothetical protein [Moorena sp. SIO3I7]NEO46583.1 hypothetical protein [Moorena sp. SIO4A3]NEO07523.1 hypothetical protein [Moorena sp. SIO3I8]NEO23204.1 hypothetical protein [Moorena sp. SIO4A5]NEQ60957.1 hypothetical protein [Moorena sp. SIO4A1]